MIVRVKGNKWRKTFCHFVFKKDVTTDLLGFMEVNHKLTIGEQLTSFINLICILQQADSMQFLTMKVAHFRVSCNASNDSSSRWHIAIKKISKRNKCISLVRSYKEKPFGKQRLQGISLIPFKLN